MFGIDRRIVSAIFRKELRAYLANPTGYVFLTLFIALTAAAAFLQDGFFARNLADLALLNKLMPAVLIFFVPAITMSAWANERQSGTDELLLTLPVRDNEVILGKYLGALGMYTVSLAFSSAHIVVLYMLGDPDLGLMFSTYLGYWLMGTLLVAIGLLASMLTSNATVAFIIGVVGCAGLVGAGAAGWAAGILGVAVVGLLAGLTAVAVRGAARGAVWVGALGSGVAMVVWLTEALQKPPEDASTRFSFEELFSVLSVGLHFGSFGEGVLRLGDVVFFLGGTAVVLYLCGFLLGRRHW